MSVFSTTPALPSRLAIALSIAFSPFTAQAVIVSTSEPADSAVRDRPAALSDDAAVNLSAVRVNGIGPDQPASTGSNLGLTPFQTPASLEVIDRAQLQARGDTTVTDAISRAGAISAMPHPGNGLSALSTRGFTDSASVMRLYDGLRQYGGIGVTFPFDTWSIERIEVLRGRHRSSTAKARSAVSSTSFRRSPRKASSRTSCKPRSGPRTPPGWP